MRTSREAGGEEYKEERRDGVTEDDARRDGGRRKPAPEWQDEAVVSLAISTADKVLAVHEGALFRARVKCGDSQSGLGMTVKSTSDGQFVVHALPGLDKGPGPAEAAGIRVGDQVVGMDEHLFETHVSLGELVDRIKRAQAHADVVLVLRRGTTLPLIQLQHDERRSGPRRVSSSGDARGGGDRQPNAMARILRSNKVIDDAQASVLTSMMAHLEARLEDWDARGDLLAGTDRCLAPPRRSHHRRRRDQPQELYFADEAATGNDDATDVGAQMGRLMLSSSASSSSARASNGSASRTQRRGLRPALCVRILGTDYNEDHTVYEIWVLDVLAGAEWRVKRRFREFFELHERLVSLRPSMEKLDFPMRRPSIYETVHSVNDRRVRLERHLRRVAGMLFSARLHERSADVTLALETFLDVPKRRASLELLERNPDLLLRQALQVAVYQLLTLPVFEKILGDLVQSLLQAELEAGSDLLHKMKAYIDHLQQCVLDGTNKFLRAIALRRQPRIPEDDLAALASNAVRRQIETDVFVPLMDKLHALLAKEIADLDTQLQFKCQSARSRPQSFFGIPLNHISPSSWESAIYQLSNIGSYTLPCDKLDALLAAAKEIPALYVAEHPGTSVHLGADDFLPIFIYVLVNAEIRVLYL